MFRVLPRFALLPLRSTTPPPYRYRLASPPNQSVEVPRKTLSREDVRAVLMREIKEHRNAAFTLASHACFEEAAAVEAEIEVLEQYIDWS
jgi:uncharacterized protein YqeY